MMTTFKLTVTYAAGHDWSATGLTADQLDQGGGAFLHDLTYLQGRGITRLVAEVESQAEEALEDYVARRA